MNNDMKSFPEYLEGFAVGRRQAEGFHKDTINARDSKIMCLSPYSKLTEPEKRAAWIRGRLDGYENYWKDKERFDVFIPGL